MASGILSFYMNALMAGLLSIKQQPGPVIQQIGLQTDAGWQICRSSFLNVGNYCDQFDNRMDLALSRVHDAINTAKHDLVRIGWIRGGRLGGFDPPPSDQVQQEIDDLKQNIIDLQNQLAQINKSGQIDDVDGKIATLQDAIAQLTVKMDTLVKDASDRFTDAVKQLQDSLASLTASTQSLKMEVANLEQDLESTEIVNIMGDIVDGATSGTAYKYEHGSFKGTLTTVLSTIISLAYDEVLDDNTFFLNIMKFLSFLKDKYKLPGCQFLYVTVIANGHLYNRGNAFMVARMIAQLAQSDDPSVASGADTFLKVVVHPIITSVVRYPDTGTSEVCGPTCQLVRNGDKLQFDKNFNDFTYQFDTDYAKAYILPDHCAISEGVIHSGASGVKIPVLFCLTLNSGSRLYIKFESYSDPTDKIDWDGAQLDGNDNTVCERVTDSDIGNTFSGGKGTKWYAFDKDLLCKYVPQ
ncbi:uncharacterized protein LOC110857183 [Folsomia candida]|nr:uncharacterized protein LOC110857183 [Folsomia candida]